MFVRTVESSLASEVHYDIEDGVARVTLDRPVANALAPSLRAALHEALRRAIADEAVQAIVLRGAGAGFSSGIDIAEYDGVLAAPWISDLCDLIENAPKPVVACLHGAVLGGGLELALASHERVAKTDAGLALPEITLGLIPGGGATQRLPRIVGAQAALEVMLSGQTVKASDPRVARVCRLVDGDPLPAAMALARDLAARGAWRRTCDQRRGFSDPETYHKSIKAVSARLGEAQGPERDILDCVEAAQLLPFERGLDFEQVMFRERLHSPLARARRHVYLAERRAAIMPEMAKVPQPRSLDRVAILGAGPVAAELAVALLDGGRQVDLAAPNAAAAETVLKQVVHAYHLAVQRQQLDPSEREARLSRLHRAEAAEAVASADLVIDMAQQDLPDGWSDPAGSPVWAVLGDGPAAAGRAAQAGQAGGALGLRAYRPAHLMPLVELAVLPDTDPQAVSAVAGLFRAMGRCVIRGSDAAGGVGHMMHAALCHAALAIAGTGATPDEIDTAAREIGFAQGPFRMMDAEGLKPVLSRLDRLAGTAGQDGLGAGGLLASRIAEGATGRAAGKGIYVYPAEGDPHPDRAVLAWCKAARGDAPAMPRGQMAQALLSALANAAARLVADKVVLRASDIDVVMVKGYGFDRQRGGPLLQADLQGLLALLRGMRDLEPLAPAIWQPHRLIKDMVKTGDGFFGRSA